MDRVDYEEVGSIKYSGQSLHSGVIDARGAGTALLGLDEAIRFFNIQQSSDLARLEYDIPVRTQEGSWEAVLMAAGAAAGAGTTAFLFGYAKKAGEKMAEHDFKDVGIKDVFLKSMSAVVTLVKLVKHTGHAKDWEAVRVEPKLKKTSVVIANPKGKELLVPIEFYEWYHKMPPKLLSKMVSALKDDRELTISSLEKEGRNSVSIKVKDRMLFDPSFDEDVSEDLLFPELGHGDYVALEGRLIRGSEKTNTVGLEYKGHIINCFPSAGSVRQYKMALFLQCRVEGTIVRHWKKRFVADRRPRLIIDRVIPLQVDGQRSLLER